MEDGISFEENALKKARDTQRASGIDTLADDSGLEVHALSMAPGIYSARYAGEHVSYSDNNRKLLQALEAIPEKERKAHFRCVAAFASGRTEHTEEGICQGRIIDSPRGKGGFGYDPLFVPDGLDQTFAELPISIKNEISHRSMAFRRMMRFLISHLQL